MRPEGRGREAGIGLVRPVTFRYDPVVHALYVYVGDSSWRIAARTVEVADDAMADIDQNGNLIGFEILGVAEPKIMVTGGRHKPVARPQQGTLQERKE